MFKIIHNTWRIKLYVLTSLAICTLALYNGCDQKGFEIKEGCFPSRTSRYYSYPEVENDYREFNGVSSAVSGTYISPMKIQDIGQITVIEDNGTFYGTPAGVIPAIKRFYTKHADVYDFITIYTNFDIPGMESLSWHVDVSQKIRGIGKPIADITSRYGSSGRLKGIQLMNSLGEYSSDPYDNFYLANNAIEFLARITSLQWSAFLRFKDSFGNISFDLLDLKHRGGWLNCIESQSDFLNGRTWRDNGDGTYTDIGACEQFGMLTLYAMGMVDRSEVPPFLVLERTDGGGCTACCFNLGTVEANARTVTIDDIIAAEGPRIPDYSSSQKTFNMAFVFITSHGNFPPSTLELQFVDKIRAKYAAHFDTWTWGRGKMNTNLVGPKLPL